MYLNWSWGRTSLSNGSALRGDGRSTGWRWLLRRDSRKNSEEAVVLKKITSMAMFVVVAVGVLRRNCVGSVFSSGGGFAGTIFPFQN